MPHPTSLHSINLCADELHIQVKRHRDKRRKRREASAAAAAQIAGAGAAPDDDEGLIVGVADAGPPGVSSAA